jgi:quinol monooxygenase YgiN
VINKIVLISKITLLPGRRSDFIEAMKVYMKRINAEPGTEIYTISESVEDPDVAWAFEIFSSQEAYEHGHKGSPEDGVLLARIAPFMAKPSEITFAVPTFAKGLGHTEAASRGGAAAEHMTEKAEEKVVMVGKATLQPGKRAEFVEAMRIFMQRVECEPGTEVYAVNESIEDPDVVWLFEVFSSQEAYEHGHHGSAADQEHLARTARLRAKPSEIHFARTTLVKGLAI